jgi:hypothetical protein
MKEEEIKLLEKYGWIIECEFPLELYHEMTNSKATGLGAYIVYNYYKNYEE